MLFFAGYSSQWEIPRPCDYSHHKLQRWCQRFQSFGWASPTRLVHLFKRFSLASLIPDSFLKLSFLVRNGIEMRRNSWQDGVLGTNCPIPPQWNFTYSFQVKDQIGSFFYFPSLHFQRASGGFGPIVINNRDLIPIPFSKPDGDISFMIGDWYTHNHTVSEKGFIISLFDCTIFQSWWQLSVCFFRH